MDTKRLTRAFTAPIKQSLLTAFLCPNSSSKPVKDLRSPKESGTRLPDHTDTAPEALRSSMDPPSGSRGAEVPILGPVREAGEQEERAMQLLTSGEACPCLRKRETTYFAHISSLWGETLLFIPQITSARPQEAGWQCSLQNLYQSTSHLTHIREKRQVVHHTASRIFNY